MPSSSKSAKPSSLVIIGIVLIFAVVLGTTVYMLANQSKKSDETAYLSPTRKVNPSPTSSASNSATISTEEQQKIEKWIEDNNLNEYGDPIDTVYTGGTPLFDETTGESFNRYNYIVKNHPDRPWND